MAKTKIRNRKIKEVAERSVADSARELTRELYASMETLADMLVQGILGGLEDGLGSLGVGDLFERESRDAVERTKKVVQAVFTTRDDQGRALGERNVSQLLKDQVKPREGRGGFDVEESAKKIDIALTKFEKGLDRSLEAVSGRDKRRIARQQTMEEEKLNELFEHTEELVDVLGDEQDKTIASQKKAFIALRALQSRHNRENEQEMKTGWEEFDKGWKDFLDVGSKAALIFGKIPLASDVIDESLKLAKEAVETYKATNQQLGLAYSGLTDDVVNLMREGSKAFFGDQWTKFSTKDLTKGANIALTEYGITEADRAVEIGLFLTEISEIAGEEVATALGPLYTTLRDSGIEKDRLATAFMEEADKMIAVYQGTQFNVPIDRLITEWDKLSQGMKLSNMDTSDLTKYYQAQAFASDLDFDIGVLNKLLAQLNDPETLEGYFDRETLGSMVGAFNAGDFLEVMQLYTKGIGELVDKFSSDELVDYGLKDTFMKIFGVDLSNMDRVKSYNEGRLIDSSFDTAMAALDMGDYIRKSLEAGLDYTSRFEKFVNFTRLDSVLYTLEEKLTHLGFSVGSVTELFAALAGMKVAWDTLRQIIGGVSKTSSDGTRTGGIGTWVSNLFGKSKKSESGSAVPGGAKGISSEGLNGDEWWEKFIVQTDDGIGFDYSKLTKTLLGAVGGVMALGDFWEGWSGVEEWQANLAGGMAQLLGGSSIPENIAKWAALGSIAGPIGTAVGGAFGAFFGTIGTEKMTEFFDDFGKAVNHFFGGLETSEAYLARRKTQQMGSFEQITQDQATNLARMSLEGLTETAEAGDLAAQLVLKRFQELYDALPEKMQLEMDITGKGWDTSSWNQLFNLGTGGLGVNSSPQDIMVYVNEVIQQAFRETSTDEAYKEQRLAGGLQYTRQEQDDILSRYWKTGMRSGDVSWLGKSREREKDEYFYTRQFGNQSFWHQKPLQEQWEELYVVESYLTDLENGLLSMENGLQMSLEAYMKAFQENKQAELAAAHQARLDAFQNMQVVVIRDKDVEPDGSNAKGLSYVPFDGYLSELHRGERVLTEEQNRAYSAIPSLDVGATLYSLIGGMVGAVGGILHDAHSGLRSFFKDEITDQVKFTVKTMKDTIRRDPVFGPILDMVFKKTLEDQAAQMGSMGDVGLPFGPSNDEGGMALPSIDLTGGVTPELVDQTMRAIGLNEGNYSSINRDDKGSLSIGKIQWHATRAGELLSNIYQMNPQAAEQAFAQGLNPVVANAVRNNDRQFFTSYKVNSDSDYNVIKALLGSTEGKAAQDQLAANNVAGYLNQASAAGITDPRAMMLVADYINKNGNMSMIKNMGAKTYDEVLAALKSIMQTNPGRYNQGRLDRVVGSFGTMSTGSIPAYPETIPAAPASSTYYTPPATATIQQPYVYTEPPFEALIRPAVLDTPVPVSMASAPIAPVGSDPELKDTIQQGFNAVVGLLERVANAVDKPEVPKERPVYGPSYMDVLYARSTV